MVIFSPKDLSIVLRKEISLLCIEITQMFLYTFLCRHLCDNFMKANLWTIRWFFMYICGYWGQCQESLKNTRGKKWSVKASPRERFLPSTIVKLPIAHAYQQENRAKKSLLYVLKTTHFLISTFLPFLADLCRFQHILDVFCLGNILVTFQVALY